jgi:hypothetical protein
MAYTSVRTFLIDPDFIQQICVNRLLSIILQNYALLIKLFSQCLLYFAYPP